MDTITHTAIGACLGEMIAGKKLGKRAMLHGAIANNFPDIDVIAQLWSSESKALLVHRGITHSIFLCLILSFLFAWYLHKRNEALPFRRWLLLYGSGLFLHILLDACTTYGTGWFEPFHPARISLNTIFILDPLFMLPVLISAIVLLIMKKDSVRRMRLARVGIIVSGLYLAFTMVNKLHVNAVAKDNLKAQGIKYDDFMATPTPLNNFLWYIVSRAPEGFHIAYYSLFDDRKDILSFEFFPRNDSLLEGNCEQDQLANLKRFTQDYYRATLENDTVTFSDVRFGQIGGWHKTQAPFVFNFRLAQKCFNKSALQKGRFESFGSETTLQLFRRIRGIKDEKGKEEKK